MTIRRSTGHQVSVPEPLPLHALDQGPHALQRGQVTQVAEAGQFVAVAVQVLGTDMVVRPHEHPRADGPGTLNAVGVDIATHLLSALVVDRLMQREADVAGVLVGVDGSTGDGVLAHDPLERLPRGVGNRLGNQPLGGAVAHPNHG